MKKNDKERDRNEGRLKVRRERERNNPNITGFTLFHDDITMPFLLSFLYDDAQYIYTSAFGPLLKFKNSNYRIIFDCLFAFSFQQ